MVEVSRVLVVGGGLAGLAAAIALRDAGFAPELVEARREWPTEGAAITMHANGVRALRRLGLGASLDAVAAVLPTWSFHDAQGDRLCETDLTQLWEGVGSCLGVTRAHLQRLLVERASGVRCRLGVAVTGVAQAQDSVTVGFAQGAPQRYDLVVGADGRHSTTRLLALGATAAQYAGTMAWRSVAPFRPDGLHHLQLYLGDGCFFGLVPVGENGTYGFAGQVCERFDDPAAGRLDRFRQRFAGFARPVEEYLAALGPGDPLHSAPIEWVNPEHWHVGRVVVVGDAAHAAPPHMGEGGSLALEDGLVLAQVLSQATEVGTALRMYEARRRPRVGWVQEQSLAAAKAWGMPPAARDHVLRERGDQMLRQRYEPLRADP